MARLRYVKNIAPDRSVKGAGMRNTVRSFRAIYQTDPEIARALVPRPLVVSAAPNIFVQFAHVIMHVAPDRDVEIGAATVGVQVGFEGRTGYYVLAMPMEGERVVVAGRERYGEPKKVAAIDFSLTNNHIHVSAQRHGIRFLEMSGTLGAHITPRPFTEYFYCFKALPAVDPTMSFDGDPLLVELEWKRNYTRLQEVHGEITLRESAHDPLIDVPVRQIIEMQYAEGSTRTGGRVVGAVPGENLLPFLPQRYDDPSNPGIEVDIASDHDDRGSR